MQQLTLLKPSQQIGRSNLLQFDSDWSKWYFIFAGWQQEKKKLYTVAVPGQHPEAEGEREETKEKL